MDFFNRIPPVTRSLIIINVIIWGFTALFPSKADVLVDLCGLHYFISPGFNPAQLLTYMFLHGGFVHLFFNMFALMMLGGYLEMTFGPKRFLFFYISCGIGAALIQEGVYAWQIHDLSRGMSTEEVDAIAREGWRIMHQHLTFAHPVMGKLNMYINGATVGASGAIYGILAAFGMLFPNMPMYIMFIPVPVKAMWVVLGYAVIEFISFGLLDDNVAHMAHIGGLVIGVIIILIWKKQNTLHGFQR